jgi:small-conductance mechanosensitive channel
MVMMVMPAVLALQPGGSAGLIAQPGALLVLLVLLLLTIPLERERQRRRHRLIHLLPSLRLFRVAIAAALLSGALTRLNMAGGWQQWTLLVALLSLYVACIDLVIGFVWQLLAMTRRDSTPAPRFFKDLLFVGASFAVITAELYQRGMLNTIGTAAVLSVLAFIVGPGSATQLQNISSALTVQVERQFEIGDWVEIDGQQGRVDNISWNSTYLYDDIFDRYVVLPNATIDKVKIINYSRPSPTDFGLEVLVGLPYEMAPAHALRLLKDVVQHHPQIPQPERARAFLKGFGASSVDYALHFFVPDFLLRYEVATDVSSRIWYAVRREGFSIPFPIVDLRTARSSQGLIAAELSEAKRRSFESLRAIELFASLSDRELELIAQEDPLLEFAPGEVIIRRGDSGGSMYVIQEGQCSVLLQDPATPSGEVEIKRLCCGEIFGEYAALTNAERTATVRALHHVSVQEISHATIEQIFLTNQSAMQEFAAVMTRREAERCAFTPAQKDTYESGLMQRMFHAFGRLLQA